MLKYLFSSLFVLVSLSCSKGNSNRIAKIPEASGIDYCADSDTLIVANDEGSYYEIDREGTILHKKRVGKYDLEGVVCREKRLIFAIEDRGLLIIGRKTGKKRQITFDTTYHEKELSLFDKKSGVEGIAKSGDTLYLAKQAKKRKASRIAILRFDRHHRKIIDLIKPKIADIAGLTLYRDSLFMVSDKKNLLIQYDLKKRKIVKKIKLPEAAWEGIAFDGKGFLYFADDDGYILKYSEKELGLP